jgi:hypothetical protein
LCYHSVVVEKDNRFEVGVVQESVAETGVDAASIIQILRKSHEVVLGRRRETGGGTIVDENDFIRDLCVGNDRLDATLRLLLLVVSEDQNRDYGSFVRHTFFQGRSIVRICLPEVELKRITCVVPLGIRNEVSVLITSVFLSQVTVSSGPTGEATGRHSRIPTVLY